MSEYEDRKARKAERFRKFSENAAARADAAGSAAHQIMDMIPLGQPILVGHHSEGRARADQGRIRRNMDKLVEESQRASYWARRADAVENDTSILKWDPEALSKLAELIDLLKARREAIKAVNAAIRKNGYEKAVELGLVPQRAQDQLMQLERLTPYQKPLLKGFPSYALTNLGGNLRRYEGRVIEVTRFQAQMRAAGKME